MGTQDFKVIQGHVFSGQWKCDNADKGLNNARWGIITGTPSAKSGPKRQTLLQCCFFGPRKHEIMLHAMSLRGGSRTLTNCVHVSCQLGTNWDQCVIDTAVSQWRRHLRACVKVKGTHSDTLWTQTESVV